MMYFKRTMLAENLYYRIAEFSFPFIFFKIITLLIQLPAFGQSH